MLDAGFYSKENFQFMCSENIKFVTRLNKSHKTLHHFVDESKDIESAGNAEQYGDRVVFVRTKKTIVYDQEMYIHVIFDPSKKSKDLNIIMRDQFH